VLRARAADGRLKQSFRMQRFVMIVVRLTAIAAVAVFVLSPRPKTANPDEKLPYAGEQ
jgi:hypothetical protein